MFAKLFLFLALTLALLFGLSGCASQQSADEYRTTPVVTTRPAVDVTAVMIVPERALDQCQPLDVPPGTSAAQVMDTMLSNHQTHGECMFKNDLKADYLRAADETGAKVRIYSRTPPPPDPAIAQ